MINKFFKIIAITIGTYPQSVASSIRHLAFLRGLQENGIEVTLLSIYSEKNYVNKVKYYNNVKIVHLINNTQKNKYLFIKMYFYFIGILKVINYISINNKNNKLDFVILYPTSNCILLPIILICKILYIKIIHERTEYPFLSFSNSIFEKIQKWVYLQIIIPSFDCLIVISIALEKYFKQYFNKKIILIPIVVESDRFIKQGKAIYNFPYIAYCGSFYITKDSIDLLIESFAQISTNFNDYKLVLIGDYQNSPDKNYIFKKISYLKLNTKIIFTGLLSLNEIPRYLNNARALVLYRKNNTQSKYGLPTKLAEYLITGKPVIVTSVGDISLYLKDNIDLFIVKSSNTKSFAKKINVVLQNYKNSLIVGKHGKNTCKNLFDYKYQAGLFVNHLKKLI